jgi:HbrB-like
MESSIHRRPARRSPAHASTSPDRHRPSSNQSHRPGSSGSDTSVSSNLASLSVAKRTPHNQQLPLFVSHANNSNTSLASHSRPSAQYMPHDGTVRKHSPLAPPADLQKHRPRQHSQGFFEPSMPSASLASQSALNDHNMSLTASQIAAQAAMQHLSDTSHQRKRSSTVPFPQEQSAQDVRRASKSSPPPPPHPAQPPNEHQYRNGLVGTSAAATAANVVFPRNLGPLTAVIPTEEKESKKGLKRFRPKNIGISRDKDKEAKEKPLPSPNKITSSGLSKVINASTTSLADSLSSNNSSMLNLANPSQSTIIPIGEKDKSHRQGLRQKLKLKDKDDFHTLPLSSASSNSRPTDINNPQSLYSFAPSSPGPSSSFAKSVSGLDLRHGGRALREKKKEERAQASANHLEQVYSRGESDISEWPSLQALGTSLTSQSVVGFTSYSNDYRDTLAGFGLNNMTPDDAWDFLKAKILAVFEGEDVRIAVEDLNRLVSIHTQRCVQKLDPSIIIGDVEELLRTGFLSLNHTLRNVADERMVPHLVSMWMQVFGKILPFMQAVFLPLDQEFKGRGAVLTSPKLAAEFWGALHVTQPGSQFSSPVAVDSSDFVVAAGEELEVRRILLISFRDTVILPRFDALKATFSRLSLDSINATLAHFETTGRDRGNSGGSERSNTAHSLDPTYASYGSQTSTLLGTASSGARSRATSSLSNSSNPAQDVAFQSFSSPPAARPGDTSSAQVTETVGRMLQCLSVICSVQSGDEAQNKMEELNKQLKLNWLGRGRTGRNRKGFVGSRVRPERSVGSTIRGNDRDGSPTPTPTRQGTVSRQGDDGLKSENNTS